MPRYFFNIRECGMLIEDPEGRDLTGADVAQRDAVRSAQSLLATEVQEGRLPLGHAIEVTDEH